ncbi:hypothetical protein [Rhizobacter sp. LjRoot28]|uniref:hypothetical protein n=1 Tax=Rhizobacter sp. LjRoot28 TaxID=3342309 RepID=UPI003ECFF219
MPAPTSRRRSTWTPRRRRGAAIQLILGGGLLMALPFLLGDSAVGHGFGALAPIGWLMLVAGVVLPLFFREERSALLTPPRRAVPFHPDPVPPGRMQAPLLRRPADDPLDRPARKPVAPRE